MAKYRIMEAIFLFNETGINTKSESTGKSFDKAKTGVKGTKCELMIFNYRHRNTDVNI